MGSYGRSWTKESLLLIPPPTHTGAYSPAKQKAKSSSILADLSLNANYLEVWDTESAQLSLSARSNPISVSVDLSLRWAATYFPTAVATSIRQRAPDRISFVST